MLVKCICTNCAGHLEFEEENAGEKIKCPHCEFETVLFLPGTERMDEELARLARKMKLRRWALRGAFGLVVLGGAGWACYRWALPLVETFLPVESTTAAWAVLACILLGIPLLLGWLALPFVLVFQLWKLNASIARIVVNLQPQTLQDESELAPESRTQAVTEDALKL